MVRAAPGVLRHGTAKDLADVANGYTASGASEHSRNSAHSHISHLNSFVDDTRPPEWARTEKDALGFTIADNARQLAALHMRLRTETNEQRRDKLRKNIQIKTKFLDRLKQEQRELLGQASE